MAAQEFNTIQENSDVFKLLFAIQGIINQFETNVSIYDALDGAKRTYYLYKQDENESNAMHLKLFKNLVSIIEYFGGNIFENQSLVDNEKEMDIKDNISARSEEQYKKIVKKKMMEVGLLKRANRKTYDKLLTHIHDQFAFNIYVYPNTLHESYELLENHSKHNHQYSDWSNTRTREDR